VCPSSIRHVVAGEDSPAWIAEDTDRGDPSAGLLSRHLDAEKLLHRSTNQASTAPAEAKGAETMTKRFLGFKRLQTTRDSRDDIGLRLSISTRRPSQSCSCKDSSMKKGNERVGRKAISKVIWCGFQFHQAHLNVSSLKKGRLEFVI
jgi:hypothetical protein